MFRLTRSVRPTAESVAVIGSMRAAIVKVRFTDPVIAPDGQVFRNHGTHWLRLRWGRICAVHLDWDPAIARACCEHTAGLGYEEAAADPLP